MGNQRVDRKIRGWNGDYQRLEWGLSEAGIGTIRGWNGDYQRLKLKIIGWSGQSDARAENKKLKWNISCLIEKSNKWSR